LRGVPVLDADEVAREVVEPGQPALAEIVQVFGRGILRRDGTLDRGRLGRIVFSDPAQRRRLEGIVHPAILARMERQIAGLRARQTPPPVVLAVLPLLFEAGCEGLVDGVLVASVSPEEQVRRLTARDGLSRAEAMARIAAQMPLEEKEARADWVVNTEVDPETLQADVDRLLAAWLSMGRRGACQAQEGPRGGPAN
jgi:dephospho-CoA kinase